MAEETMTYVVVRKDAKRAIIIKAVLAAWQGMEDDAANDASNDRLKVVVVSNEQVLCAMIAEAVLNHDYVSAQGYGGDDEMIGYAAVIGPSTGCGPMLKELAHG